MRDSIFIAIASFLDYEIVYTILDCIYKADHPDRLHFSVCLQYNDEPETNQYILDNLVDKYSIKVDKFRYEDSQGGCWARQIAQQNYNKQTYSLQVDSHTRFIKGWDTIVINDYTKLKNQGVVNPLLTFLPPSYSRVDEIGIDVDFKHLYNLDRLNIPKFKRMTHDYWLEYVGYGDEVNINFTPTKIKILYGGFVFTDGKWVKTVEQDPEHYYTGEELALAIRSYTHGYDLFTPSQIVAWHRAHRKPLPKHFTINSEEVGKEKHNVAMVRLRKLVENGNLGKYGAGTKRTVSMFEKYAGLDFKNRLVLNEDI